MIDPSVGPRVTVKEIPAALMSSLLKHVVLSLSRLCMCCPRSHTISLWLSPPSSFTSQQTLSPPRPPPSPLHPEAQKGVCVLRIPSPSHSTFDTRACSLWVRASSVSSLRAMPIIFNLPPTQVHFLAPSTRLVGGGWRMDE